MYVWFSTDNTPQTDKQESWGVVSFTGTDIHMRLITQISSNNPYPISCLCLLLCRLSTVYYTQRSQLNVTIQVSSVVLSTHTLFHVILHFAPN